MPTSIQTAAMAITSAVSTYRRRDEVLPLDRHRSRRSLLRAVGAAPADLTRGGAILGVMRRADPERLHLARRAARLARLGDAGMASEAAERAIAAWEAEAASRGLSRDDPSYWDTGEAWVLERRRCLT